MIRNGTTVLFFKDLHDWGLKALLQDKNTILTGHVTLNCKIPEV